MHDQMTFWGWIFMLLTWVAICGLNLFCFSRIFKDKKEEIPDPMSELDVHNRR